MTDASNLKEFEALLKRITTATELSEEEVAVKANRNKGYISQIRSRAKQGQPIPVKFMELLSLRFATELGEGNLSFQDRRQTKKLAPVKKRVPLYDAEASASDMGMNMTPVHGTDGTIDVGDLLQDSTAALRIYGNSMSPNYPPGCVVGLVKSSKSFIQPGEVYVVETRESRVLKRLFYRDDNPKSDVFVCYSDNTMLFESGARAGRPAYPPFEIPKEEVTKLFIVTGVIKRNTNSLVMHKERQEA